MNNSSSQRWSLCFSTVTQPTSWPSSTMISQPSMAIRTSNSGDHEPQSATAYSCIQTSCSHTRKGLSVSMAGRLEIIGVTSECRKKNRISESFATSQKWALRNDQVCRLLRDVFWQVDLPQHPYCGPIWHH